MRQRPILGRWDWRGRIASCPSPILSAREAAVKASGPQRALTRSNYPNRTCAALEPSFLSAGARSEMQTPTAVADESDGARRRDFLNIAAVSFGAVGAGAVLLPLINQMNPSGDILAVASIEVDLSSIAPGQAVKVLWRKQPVFIRNLSPAEIQAAKAVPLDSLRDPETLQQRTIRENWLITIGICTHLGCVPLGVGDGENRGEFGGYFCPCHGSHYDTAARIRKGPAPLNLVVPEYEFLSDTLIRIG